MAHECLLCFDTRRRRVGILARHTPFFAYAWSGSEYKNRTLEGCRGFLAPCRGATTTARAGSPGVRKSVPLANIPARLRRALHGSRCTPCLLPHCFLSECKSLSQGRKRGLSSLTVKVGIGKYPYDFSRGFYNRATSFLVEVRRWPNTPKISQAAPARMTRSIIQRSNAAKNA